MERRKEQLSQIDFLKYCVITLLIIGMSIFGPILLETPLNHRTNHVLNPGSMYHFDSENGRLQKTNIFRRILKMELF
jgi:hypothetical protein